MGKETKFILEKMDQRIDKLEELLKLVLVELVGMEIDKVNYAKEQKIIIEKTLLEVLTEYKYDFSDNKKNSKTVVGCLNSHPSNQDEVLGYVKTQSSMAELMRQVTKDFEEKNHSRNAKVSEKVRIDVGKQQVKPASSMAELMRQVTKDFEEKNHCRNVKAFAKIKENISEKQEKSEISMAELMRQITREYEGKI